MDEPGRQSAHGARDSVPTAAAGGGPHWQERRRGTTSVQPPPSALPLLERTIRTHGTLPASTCGAAFKRKVNLMCLLASPSYVSWTVNMWPSV